MPSTLTKIIMIARAARRIAALEERNFQRHMDWIMKVPEGNYCEVRKMFNSGPYVGRSRDDVMQELGYPRPVREEPSDADLALVDRISKLYG